MAIKLFYITNDVEVAKIIQKAGCDRVFVDMEHIGKAARQGGMDTVQSRHTISDVAKLRSVVGQGRLLVRCNPIHDATAEYNSSEAEIDAIITAGADVIMLPYYKSNDEVRRFLTAVGGRCRTMLLLETPEAVEILDETLEIPGIDEMFIGLNDLSLAYGMKFMFQLLADGTVERLALKIRQKEIPFGFGGIAAIGAGTLPAEAILKEHYRLGSSMVILSRSFCDCSKVTDLTQIEEKFMTGLAAMRECEKEIAVHSCYFDENRALVSRCVDTILSRMQK